MGNKLIVSNTLGIDVGQARVGIAILSATLPTPLCTVQRAAGKAEKRVIELLSEYKISKIVVGLPLNEDGTESAQCDDVRRFARRIERRTGALIVFIDEYSSSLEAEERLYARGVSRPERAEIDALAAAIILERYLQQGSG
jgi:putative Holliday junction resolvase